MFLLGTIISVALDGAIVGIYISDKAHRDKPLSLPPTSLIETALDAITYGHGVFIVGLAVLRLLSLPLSIRR